MSGPIAQVERRMYEKGLLHFHCTDISNVFFNVLYGHVYGSLVYDHMYGRDGESRRAGGRE